MDLRRAAVCKKSLFSRVFQNRRDITE